MAGYLIGFQMVDLLCLGNRDGLKECFPFGLSQQQEEWQFCS